ncbi:hypothetical protein BDP27DRAFT_1369209 [Rhodocollybia butyracea]|uniref:Uncharacterized protein n=1 Tax=Rhodocollybia butyracea TaxID=206335 RepID=A0A9P5U0M3_9AGAR|nr:hypothetical protein BDP27DRAFT_1369209 [Rhodocollybia butyracea]
MPSTETDHIAVSVLQFFIRVLTTIVIGMITDPAAGTDTEFFLWKEPPGTRKTDIYSVKECCALVNIKENTRNCPNVNMPNTSTCSSRNGDRFHSSLALSRTGHALEFNSGAIYGKLLEGDRRKVDGRNEEPRMGNPYARPAFHDPVYAFGYLNAWRSSLELVSKLVPETT